MRDAEREALHEDELGNAASIRWPSFSSISSMADSRCHSRRVCMRKSGGEEGGAREGIPNLIQRGDEELGVVPHVARLCQARILFRYGREDTLRDAHLCRIKARVRVGVGGEIRVNYYPAMGMDCLVLRGQNLLPQTRELRAVEKVRHAGGILGAVPVKVRFRVRLGLGLGLGLGLALGLGLRVRAGAKCTWP